MITFSDCPYPIWIGTVSQMLSTVFFSLNTIKQKRILIISKV